MPREKDFKRHVRRRMQATGECYMQARERLRPAEPVEWRLGAVSCDAYEHVVERDPQVPDGRVDMLRSVADPVGVPYGELVRRVPAGDLRGARVRCSVLLRGEDAASGASLQVTASDADGFPLAWGYMRDERQRELRGTFAWTAAEVVLDVPPGAARLDVGVRLEGQGAVRLAGDALTVVERGVPVTSAVELVAGWWLEGTAPDRYELVAERDESTGRPRQVCRLTSVPGAPGVPAGFGTMSRVAAAAPFRGRRLRFSVDVRGDAVARAAAWVRADDAEGSILALNNMQHRALSGTFGWTRVAVVVNVPEQAATIGHGVLLHGRGTVRIADARLEPVDATVGDTLPAAPVPRWAFLGLHPEAYEVAVEEAGSRGRALRLRSVPDRPEGMLVLAQHLIADCYRGGRIRFGASVRSDHPDSRVALWLRAEAGVTLVIDNMEGRSLRGAFNWTPAEVAVDVPAEATAVVFGLYLAGPGSVHLAGLHFDASGAGAEPPPESRPRDFEFAEI